MNQRIYCSIRNETTNKRNALPKSLTTTTFCWYRKKNCNWFVEFVCVCDLNFWVIHCWRLALIICSSREKKIWAEKKFPASVSGSVNNLLDCKMWSLFSRRFCTFFSVCVLLNYVPTCANNENAALHLCMHSRAKYNVWIYTMQHSILQAGCTLHTLPAK